MSIKSLKLKNYMSFNKANIELPQRGLFFISGINYDSGGRNGIGKSALVESFVYAIYGKCIRPGSKDIKELITIGKRELVTDIVIGNYSIYRRRTKKQSGVRIVDISSGNELTKRTNTETDNLINQIFVPYEQFIFTNYFNPQLSVFFALTPKQRFQTIEQILGLQILDDIHDEYKIAYQSLLDELQSLNLKKTELTSKVELLEKQIDSINHRIYELEQNIRNVNNEKECQVNQLKQSFNNLVKQFKDEIGKIQSNIDYYKNQLNQLQYNIKDIGDVSELYQKQNEINQAINNISIEINELNNIVKSISKLKTGKCPTCGQPISSHSIDNYIKEASNGKVSSESELNNRIKDLLQKKLELESELNELNELQKQYMQYTEIQKLIEQLEKQYHLTINQWQSQYPEIVSFVINYDVSAQSKFIERMLSENSNNVNNKIQSYNILLGELKEQKKKLEQELVKNESNLSSIQSKLDELSDKVEKLQLTINELSHTGEFRQLFISSYIKELEHTLNVMVSKLHPHFKLKLEITQSGRNKGLNVIVYDKDIEKSYAQLSTGERRMVDMSLMLAFSTLNNMFIIVDEALDSLSYENQVKVVNLLGSLNKQVFIVTHNQRLIEEFEHPMKHIIWIEKENGESKVTVQ